MRDITRPAPEPPCPSCGSTKGHTYTYAADVRTIIGIECFKCHQNVPWTPPGVIELNRRDLLLLAATVVCLAALTEPWYLHLLMVIVVAVFLAHARIVRWLSA